MFFIISLNFLGCNNKSVPIKESQAMDYFERILPALSPLAEEDVMLSTLAYIDDIITKEGNKNIKSIYYNKAQLLYKMKRYNEALNVMYQIDDKAYDAHLAALLICLGWENEAISLLQNVINVNKTVLNELSISKEERNRIIMGTILLYILADRSPESLCEELVNSKITTQQEADNLLKDNKITKEIILQSMWG
jgi:tetratricopeptide (TPR) repeat protein